MGIVERPVPDELWELFQRVGAGGADPSAGWWPASARGPGSAGRVRREPQPTGGLRSGHHQALLMVVTELERITADPAGAAGKVWQRLGRDEWQTLGEAWTTRTAIDLYVVQWEEAKRRQAEREAAEREAQRPVYTAAA